MQSPAPPQDSQGSFLQFLKEPGYYLWLAAIGAIVYAYLFANNSLDETNKTDATKTDPATRNPTTNTGNRVVTLLPFVCVYAVFAKALTSFSFGSFGAADNMWKYIFYPIVILVTLVMLAFVSIWATQTTDGVNLIIHGERTGLFSTNMAFIGFVIVGSLISALVGRLRGGTGIDPIRNSIYTFLQVCLRFILTIWFPVMMMYYFVKTGATYWFQVVACASIGTAIATLVYDWFKIKFNMEPLKD
jgi:hypothetical protein